MSKKQKKPSPIIDDLMTFLDASPTAWHAVEQMKQKLQKAGFSEISEQDSWSLQPGKRYFTVRNGSTLCAFITPTKELQEIRIVGSHTDSPALKLKPKGEFKKENMTMFSVEVYGGPLLTSWLNRDLGIAGRIVVENAKGAIEEKLVNCKENPLIIPQLAIHLDRKVNEEGLLLNKQEHLSALATIDPSFGEKKPYLDTLLRSQASYKHLLASDLFLYPLEPARLAGYQNELISSYRLDSLGSVHAAVTAFVDTKPSKNRMAVAVFWDHEEIGSSSASGAGSPFLPHLLERICLSLGHDRNDYLRLLSRSYCVSIDLSHALHPNYPEKHDPRHQPLLGEGLVVKSNAQQRYATDARTSAPVIAIAHKRKLKIQPVVARSDIPCGSTIGPIQATLTGVPTVDIGYTQLSMHSSRELAACQDHLDMVELVADLLVSN